MKLHAFLLKRTREKDKKGAIRKQENAYRKNFFSLAKDACNGPWTRRASSQSSPRRRLSTSTKPGIQTLDIYISQSLTGFCRCRSPTTATTGPPSGPGPNTATGEDGMLHGVLAKLPSVHHFFATLYNKLSEGLPEGDQRVHRAPPGGPVGNPESKAHLWLLYTINSP